ncbi:MAG: UPF0716 protein FxsA [Phenylobacterium sp.]|jgi:UPF0716 protein FxsA
MFKILFLMFLIIPIIEISILIQLSDVIGGWPTILLVIVTAYLGAKMVKQQGMETIEQVKAKADSGQIPAEELFAGVCILISGVLLVTPGILTDVVGFLLLTPMIRERMAAVLKEKIHLFGANGSNAAFGGPDGQPTEDGANPFFTFTSSSHHQAGNDEGNIYEGEVFEAEKPVEKLAEKQPNNTIEGEFGRKE